MLIFIQQEKLDDAKAAGADIVHKWDREGNHRINLRKNSLFHIDFYYYISPNFVNQSCKVLTRILLLNLRKCAGVELTPLSTLQE